MNKRYCQICHRRIVPHTQPQTVKEGSLTITYSFYVSDSTEPVCFGHEGWGEFLPPERVPVPQAFHEAFSEKELQP
jgi:hypothetical protein